MLRATFILKNGQKEDIHILDYTGSFNALAEQMTNKFGMGWEQAVSEMHVMGIACITLELNRFDGLDRLSFDPEINRDDRPDWVNDIFIPTTISCVIENVPKRIRLLRCSSWTTITNFDELLENGAKIVMRERMSILEDVELLESID